MHFFHNRPMAVAFRKPSLVSHLWGRGQGDSGCLTCSLQKQYMSVHQGQVVSMKTDEPSATLVRADQILAFVDRIAAAFKPRRIILFGSYACGSATPDSDVD